MTNEERTQKLQELMADEEFLKSTMDMETPAELRAAFAARGLEMTEDEVIRVVKLVNKEENDELNEESLENVAGGSILRLWPPFPLFPLPIPFPRWPRIRIW